MRAGRGTKQSEGLSAGGHCKSWQSYFPSTCGPRGDIHPVLDPHIGSQSPEDWHRHTQTVFREATPASSSAGQWPKAVACSRGDGLCWHTRHQEGTPACDRGCECKLISSRQHIAWLRQRARCRGRWLWLSRSRFGRGLIKAITSVLLLHFPLILYSELSHTEF